MGRTPVRAADEIGFIANRCARPFSLEALRLLGDRRRRPPSRSTAIVPPRRRLSDGPVRADGPGRRRRRLRGREVLLGAELPRAALAAAPDPGEDGRRRPPRPQDRPRLLRLLRRSPTAPRIPSPRSRHRRTCTEWQGDGSIDLPPSDAGRRSLERIVCQLVNEAAFALGKRDRQRRGHRHRDAARLQLAARTARVGRRDRPRPRARGPRRAAPELGEERYRAAPLLRRRAADGTVHCGRAPTGRGSRWPSAASQEPPTISARPAIVADGDLLVEQHRRRRRPRRPGAR